MYSGAKIFHTNILVSKIYEAHVIKTVDADGKQHKYKKPIGKPLQLVIYNCTIKSGPDAAIAIPFPIVGNRFKLLDFKYHRIFDDIAKNFDIEDDELVKTTSDYDTKVTSLNGLKSYPKIYEYACKYYPRGFGFILCVVSSAKFNPIAYYHELRPNKKLFVPIRVADTVDHNVYVVNDDLKNIPHTTPKSINGISFSKIPEHITFNKVKTIKKVDLRDFTDLYI